MSFQNPFRDPDKASPEEAAFLRAERAFGRRLGRCFATLLSSMLIADFVVGHFGVWPPTHPPAMRILLYVLVSLHATGSWVDRPRG